jgi:hypothetical protein
MINRDIVFFHQTRELCVSFENLTGQYIQTNARFVSAVRIMRPAGMERAFFLFLTFNLET